MAKSPQNLSFRGRRGRLTGILMESTESTVRAGSDVRGMSGRLVDGHGQSRLQEETERGLDTMVGDLDSHSDVEGERWGESNLVCLK